MPIGIDLSTMPMGGFTFPIPKNKEEENKKVIKPEARSSKLR